MKTSLFRTRTASLAGALLLAVTISAQAGGKGKHATETQNFTLATGAKIDVKGNKSATLADIKVGDHVSIAYTQTNGVLTATRIKDAGPDSVTHTKNATHKTNTTKPARTGLHARGIVESVDVATQALAITEKAHR